MKHLENEKLTSFCWQQTSCSACDMEGVCQYLVQEFKKLHSDDETWLLWPKSCMYQKDPHLCDTASFVNWFRREMQGNVDGPECQWVDIDVSEFEG